MTATMIAVEDVDAEPEESRDEAAGSEASTQVAPGHGVEVGEPPAEPPPEPPAEPPAEPAVAKARPATAKIRCPKCGKELLPKTYKYSHDCGGTKKPRPSGAQLLEEDPILDQPPPPDPGTPSSSDAEPPPASDSPPMLRSAQQNLASLNSPTEGREPRHKMPMLDRRQTPDLRVRALMRQSSSSRPQRFAGLLAGSLPS